MKTSAWGDLHRSALKCVSLAELRSLLAQALVSEDCERCTRHASEYFRTYPVKEGMPLAYFKYTVDFHNHVNRMVGKRELTYDDALAAATAPKATASQMRQSRKQQVQTGPARVTTGHATAGASQKKPCSSCNKMRY